MVGKVVVSKVAVGCKYITDLIFSVCYRYFLFFYSRKATPIN